MSKFCGQCGAQLSDDAVFCSGCGAKTGESAPVQNVIPNAVPTNGGVDLSKDGAAAQPSVNAGNFIPNDQNAYASPAGNVSGGANIQYGLGSKAASLKSKLANKNAKIALIGVGVLIIALIIVSAIAFSGSYKDPLDNLVKVYEDGNGKALKNVMPAAQVEILEKTFDIVGEDIDDYFDETAKDVHDDIVSEYGPKPKISYEILEKEKLDKADLADIADDYSLSALGLSKKSDVKVTEGYNLAVVLTIKGSTDSNTEKMILTVAKVDGDWIFVNDSLNKLDLD